jgi:hypothetical protein
MEVVHPYGHVFLLSDLFLVCEKMASEDKDRWGRDGPDMWLCYPPLAGKVLQVSEVSGQGKLFVLALQGKPDRLQQKTLSGLR